MASLDTKKLKKDLRTRLGRFISTESRQHHPHLYKTLEEIRENGYPAYLCGGAVRDMLLCNTKTPRDLDIILAYVSTEKLSELFSKNVKGRTGLGGLKLQVKDWSIDMWPLKDTWAFREGKIAGNGFSDYPKTTFLNIDAVAIQLFAKGRKKREIYSNGFFEAICTKTIELNYETNASPSTCIVRALRIADQFKFSIGPKLARYMVSSLNRTDLEEMASVYQLRYMSKSFSVDILNKCLKSIEDQLRTSAKSSVQIYSLHNSNSIEQHPCLF